MKIPPEPAGSNADPKSKIYPWKRTDYTVIGTRRPISRSTSSRESTLSPVIQVRQQRKGAEDGKQKYSGNWKGVQETMVFSMNHQVAPKARP